jgi:hypothetical protein
MQEQDFWIGKAPDSAAFKDSLRYFMIIQNSVRMALSSG